LAVIESPWYDGCRTIQRCSIDVEQMSSLTSNDEHTPGEGTVTRLTPVNPVREGLPHPDRDDLELAAILHALSDPVRLQIIATVADGREWTCGGLGLPVSKSTCTHHLAVLREAGVIRQRIVGTRKLNSLRREDLDSCFPGLLDAVVAGAPPPPAPGPPTAPPTRLARSARSAHLSAPTTGPAPSAPSAA
jgi:DNA-binding transcriptional ArsR family regulator